MVYLVAHINGDGRHGGCHGNAERHGHQAQKLTLPSAQKRLADDESWIKAKRRDHFHSGDGLGLFPKHFRGGLQGALRNCDGGRSILIAELDGNGIAAAMQANGRDVDGSRTIAADDVAAILVIALRATDRAGVKRHMHPFRSVQNGCRRCSAKALRRSGAGKLASCVSVFTAPWILWAMIRKRQRAMITTKKKASLFTIGPTSAISLRLAGITMASESS